MHDAIRPRIFIDADVLIAGSGSPNKNSASLVLLRMAEISLIKAITSQQVICESERNLKNKIPKALPAFQLLVQKSLKVVRDPIGEELQFHHGKADPKDLPILISAFRENCAYLATFNIRHYQPGLPNIHVLKPGDLVLRIRHQLAYL